jgi:hypothetical protein
MNSDFFVCIKWARLAVSPPSISGAKKSTGIILVFDFLHMFNGAPT